MRTRLIRGKKYLIRGNWTPQQLEQQYKSFVAKYGDNLSFEHWLVERGKVYFEEGKKQNPSCPKGKFIPCKAVKFNKNGSVSIKK